MLNRYDGNSKCESVNTTPLEIAMISCSFKLEARCGRRTLLSFPTYDRYNLNAFEQSTRWRDSFVRRASGIQNAMERL
jgi:hypothetical protein